MSIRIAVEGCCHGELKQIYDNILSIEESQRPEILFICGDFQALRSKDDFSSISMPEKYKRLGDFQEYYNGKEKALLPTVFIGGNHEASNYLHELKYGGFVAENIYFMGYSNVIWFRGLRIGGISGIFKHFDFYKPHFETIPLDQRSVRSIYHTRFEDYLKLSMIKDLNINIFLSHDWPEGIVHYGDLNGLLRRKAFFKADIEKNELGNPSSMLLLKRLMPHYWFSAHLHVRFEAVVPHDIQEDSVVNYNKRKLSGSFEDGVKRNKNCDEIGLDLDDVNDDEIKLDLGEQVTNSNKDEIELDLKESVNENEISLEMGSETKANSNNDEIDIDLDDGDFSTKLDFSSAKGFSQTNFTALDKCLPKRYYIKYLTIPVTNTEHESYTDRDGFYHDLEFMKIVKWFGKFQKREVLQNLRIESVNEGFIEQFTQEINDIKINAKGSKITQKFEASVENPSQQTNELISKFQL